MLGREFRITTAQEYNNIYKNGNKIPGRYIILYVLPNLLGYNRYGLVTSKKVGKAVQRNRTKRQLREIIRQMDPLRQQGYDFVLIARYNSSEADYLQLEKDLNILMRKAKV